MRFTNSRSFSILGFAGLLLLCSAGCGSSIRPESLTGTWRDSRDGMTLTWTFSPDGAFRQQLQHQNPVLDAMGGNIEVRGRWRLQGGQLTITSDTAPPTRMPGRWAGSTFTARIRRLTESELEFEGGDIHFRR